MAKVLFISNNEDYKKELQEILHKNSHNFLTASDELGVYDIMHVEHPEIVVLDNNLPQLETSKFSKLVTSTKEKTILILLTSNDNISQELLKYSNAFLITPLSEKLLLSTINANLKNKKSLELLSNSNDELAQSLYQLETLYNTSSQFASSLEKDKLIDIMLEGMDKSLGFSIACTLTFRSENEPVLIINSLYRLSERLIEALKLRAVLNYKSLFDKKEMPFELNIGNLKVEQQIKNSFGLDEYDFAMLKFDNMFAPINLSENFYGFIEIFREQDFNTEDMKCFQTIAQQVSLPLRNASLYQEIKKTNKKLEKLERLKSEFISIVSHELRTPLTAIKNSIDLILMGTAGPLSDNIYKFLNLGKDNVKRLSDIINDLLDLSKIEAGKMDFKFAITRIEPIIEYIYSTYSEIVKSKNLELTVNIEDNLAHIYADSNRLEQVLINLVSNAMKFTPKGGKIEISSKIVDAKELQYDECFTPHMEKLKGKYVMVCVSDEGVGIDKKNLNNIFDQFSQIENSLSREAGGTGLGLPIARQLLDAHNGAIWCSSELSKGSKFYFVVPLANDKNNFWITHKQLIQQAKATNTKFVTLVLRSNKILIDKILDEDGLINKAYLNNSLIETEGDDTILTMVIPDGDSFLASFIKKKISSFVCNEKPDIAKYDIMYSYSIYPEEK